MPSTKEIRTRIKSVKNTSQITRAMQLVAASKMKRAQDNALAGRSYAILLAEILDSVTAQIKEIQHPLLTKREVKTRGILVISTDKGLCGALNANLFKQITEIKDTCAFVTVGKKAAQFISRTRRNLLAEFSISDDASFKEIRPIVEMMLESFATGQIDSIEILYPRYVNTLVQEPTLTHLVPIDCLHEELQQLKERMNVNLADSSDDEREMIFEPDTRAILDELPALYIKQEIYQMIMESKASEHSARMVAMKAATDNAKNLVDDLTLQYNKARQAAITQEILEIAAATASN